MPLGMEVGLGPGDFVFDGDPAYPTGWMKTPLGTEVDFNPGYIVLDGVTALRERGTSQL